MTAICDICKEIKPCAVLEERCICRSCLRNIFKDLKPHEYEDAEDVSE
jgi:hypothetical protein